MTEVLFDRQMLRFLLTDHLRNEVLKIGTADNMTIKQKNKTVVIFVGGTRKEGLDNLELTRHIQCNNLLCEFA